MKHILIPKLAIKYAHPQGLADDTDQQYARVATEICDALGKLGINDIPQSGLKLIATNLALYLEDVVADAGIFRSFTTEMKSRYGKFLPFFEIDESQYFQDEPNIEDVRLLIWYYMLIVQHGNVGNPESPVLGQMTEAAYKVIDEQFEQVAVNDSLKAYFTEAQFTADFYQQRQVLSWLCSSCYLTFAPQYADILNQNARQFFEQRCALNPDQAFYLADSLVSFALTHGPLKLTSPEWLAMILRANGNDKAADIVSRQRFMDLNMYKIEKAEPGKSVTLSTNHGETFTVSADGLNNPQPEVYEKPAIFGSFVEYNGEWLVNGNAVWTDGLDSFDAAREEYLSEQRLKPLYDKLVKEAGGTPLYYFADTKELKQFLLEKLPTDDNAKDITLPQGHKYIALYIPADGRDFEIYPDAALSIKDERNPYYRSKGARNLAFNLALSVSDELRHYLLAHGMLPDATINSVFGLDRGNEIVQQDFDFMTRAVKAVL